MLCLYCLTSVIMLNNKTVALASGQAQSNDDALACTLEVCYSMYTIKSWQQEAPDRDSRRLSVRKVSRKFTLKTGPEKLANSCVLKPTDANLSFFEMSANKNSNLVSCVISCSESLKVKRNWV